MSPSHTANRTLLRPARQDRQSRRRLAVVAVLLLVVLAACSSNDSASEDTGAVDTSAQDQEVTVDAAAAGELGLADGAAAPAQAPAADSAEEADGPSLPPTSATSTSGTVLTGERIIKDGTVTIQVDPGQFDGAFGQLISRAQALGGDVTGSSSAIDGEGLVSGQVTIRVPVRNFEDLLTVLGEAGEVIDRNITSQDVTEEFTDLESRQRNLQAQERFYLGLLDQASSVTDAIAVQQQLEGIQTQIEQITGRLNLLDNRSSFSTLTVRIRELGADAVVDGSEGASLTTYLQTARDTLIGTVGALIIGLTFALPFLVLALLAWLVIRSIRRQRQTRLAYGSPHTAPVPASDEVSSSGADEAPADADHQPIS